MALLVQVAYRSRSDSGWEAQQRVAQCRQELELSGRVNGQERGVRLAGAPLHREWLCRMVRHRLVSTYQSGDPANKNAALTAKQSFLLAHAHGLDAASACRRTLTRTVVPDLDQAAARARRPIRCYQYDVESSAALSPKHDPCSSRPSRRLVLSTNSRRSNDWTQRTVNGISGGCAMQRLKLAHHTH